MKAAILACACLALSVAPHLWAQSAPRIIVGQVVDSATGLPLDNATVQLVRTGASIQSDSSGTFRLVRRDTARSGTLRTLRVGYEPSTLTLTQRLDGDSIVVGRIALAESFPMRRDDRVPDCRELTGVAPRLRTDSLREWIQERTSPTGGVTLWLCRVKIVREMPTRSPGRDLQTQASTRYPLAPSNARMAG